MINGMSRIPSHVLRQSIFAVALIAAAGFFFQACAHGPDRRDDGPWSDRLYNRYDHKSFRKFKPAGQAIERGKLDRSLLAAAIFYTTNEQRAKHNLPPLVFYGALAEAAAEHSSAMMHRNFFSHNNPADKKGRTPDERFKQHKIPLGEWGENIAKTPVDEKKGETYLAFAKKLVKQWMNSREHRKNILDPGFKYLGCGVAAAKGKDGFFYIASTQDFSSKASPQARN